MSRRALAGGYGPAQQDGRKRPQKKTSQTPLDFALAVMRDDSKPDALRAGMAKAALPYLHARGEERDDEKDHAPEREPKAEPLSDLELARRIAHILTRAEKAATRSEGEDTTSRSVSAAPQEPPASAEQPQPLPSTPVWRDDEDARGSDAFDPHPGYRWI